MIELLTSDRDWLHPELDKHIEGIAEIVDSLNYSDANIPDLDNLSFQQLEALDWFYGLPTYCNEQAIVAPLLNPKVCDALIQYIEGKQFKTNEEEETQYRIPELVLSQKDPGLFKSISEFAKNSLFLLYNLHWGKYPCRIESIQLAKYEPGGIKKTGWHHDADSNMTGVVNLAPELYEGGGTDLRTNMLAYEHVPPIPKGHVLIFNGNAILHRGSEVESGTRNLLVFWITTDRT
jgi:hypothetical protein